jgi:hypothetical protein
MHPCVIVMMVEVDEVVEVVEVVVVVEFAVVENVVMATLEVEMNVEVEEEVEVELTKSSHDFIMLQPFGPNSPLSIAHTKLIKK